MATVTPNFNWPVPTSTDLVKDGATAIEALGDSIDGSLVDLKGGTTGQVLSKTSGTDMDFTWVTTDDANAIQNSIVDAKGDLISATANDTPARLAVGANGETLVADSSTSTGLRWQGDYAAGVNKIINGDFGVWQRGTSFAVSSGTYYADRWVCDFANASPTSATVSRETFTPATAPVAGYEGTFFLRQTITTVGSTTTLNLTQKIENVRTFAGQTATVSFWAKSDSNRTQTIFSSQNFGSGGSSTVNFGTTTFATTTSWQRFTFTFSVPSISGKTIGTSSFLTVVLRQALADGSVLDIWGVQYEAGSVATAFQTATGTIQGELSACQRYYWRQSNNSNTQAFGSGVCISTTSTRCSVQFPVEMRINPTSVDFSNLGVYDGGAGVVNATNVSINANGKTSALIAVDVASGLTQFRPVVFLANNVSNHLGFNAEL